MGDSKFKIQDSRATFKSKIPERKSKAKFQSESQKQNSSFNFPAHQAPISGLNSCRNGGIRVITGLES